MGSLTGCARYPATPTGQTSSLLIVTIPVAGSINPNYYYFIALQAPNPGAFTPPATTPQADPTLGPFAVVRAIPGQSIWGNGWGTGRITDYVMFNGGQATQYSVNCTDPSCPSIVSSNPGVPLGPPFQWSISGDRQQFLTVSINLSTLGLNGTGTNPSHAIPPAVVVNVITTDHITVNPNDPPKPVDSIDGNLPQITLGQSKVVNVVPPNTVQFPSNNVNNQDIQLDQSQPIRFEVRL